MSTVLVDSNIFVYAFDPADTEKHQKALQVIEGAIHDGNLVLSAQVLNEVTSTLLRRGTSLGLGVEEVREIVDEINQVARVVALTPEMTLKALHGALRHGLSFWDGLIWAAAHLHQVSTIYTEDFQHGRDVEGVRFLNPFIS